MKRAFLHLVLGICILGFNSCANDIEVLAPYEENAAIYALLDPNASTQFIKINKVFINPNAKASDVAKIADSLYFDSITPELVELETGNRFPLTRANIALKDSGYFANSPNYLYVTKQRINFKNNYQIELTLPSSGKKVVAKTNIVYTPFVAYPVSPSQKIIAIQTTSTMQIQFGAPKNGKIFDAYFVFNYTEIDAFDTSKKTDKSIEWKILRSYRTLSDQGKEYVIQRIPGILFYDLLLNNIPYNPNIIRKFKPCSFMLVSGNQELDNYIQASTPSIGIVQKQSEYTNVSNGVGIFGSRNTYYIDQVDLSDITKNTIVSGADYKKMGFVK
jgi:hypothetical protein